jgi:hypothetical protein
MKADYDIYTDWQVEPEHNDVGLWPGVGEELHGGIETVGGETQFSARNEILTVADRIMYIAQLFNTTRGIILLDSLSGAIYTVKDLPRLKHYMKTGVDVDPDYVDEMEVLDL